MYDLSVFVGRFSPFHNGHLAVLQKALSVSKKVLVIIGSANSARNIRNPFTAEEREDMIRLAVGKDASIDFHYLSDHPYDDGKWVASLQRIVGKYDTKSVCLIGHSKDSSSYYLKLFPTWDSIDVNNVDNINATDLREEFFQTGYWNTKTIPKNTHLYLCSLTQKNDGYKLTENFRLLVDEYYFIQNYKKSWKDAPFPPTFVTTDAVVTQSGHVLLIERKFAPGKGLWALPGGFLNQEERILDCVIRELKEETKIKVPVPVLYGSVKTFDVFDAPNRSLRGRTITHAYHIDLGNDVTLPKLRAADDAAKVKWVPYSELRGDNMFEDHFAICDYFLNI